MLTLDLATEPRWLDLPLGVRLKLRPLTTTLMIAARSDPALRGLPAEAGDEAVALVFGKALARIAILDWEGVGDAAGDPVPVSPEGIDALLDLWPVFERFQTGYVARGLELDAEKNASAPSPTGSGAGARATAPPAPDPARTAHRS